MIARIDGKTKVMRGEADRRITNILKISMEFSDFGFGFFINKNGLFKLFIAKKKNSTVLALCIASKQFFVLMRTKSC